MITLITIIILSSFSSFMLGIFYSQKNIKNNLFSLKQLLANSKGNIKVDFHTNEKSYNFDFNTETLQDKINQVCDSARNLKRNNNNRINNTINGLEKKPIDESNKFTIENTI